jgi:hypothetical protein
MTPVQMIQLGGFVVAGSGLALSFFSARQTLGRVLTSLGLLVVAAGFVMSPEFRDAEFWKQPVVYLGLLIGVGLLFAIAALFRRRDSRK